MRITLMNHMQMYQLFLIDISTILYYLLQLQTHEHMPDAPFDGLDDPRAHGPRRSTEGLDGRAIRRANML